MQESRARSHGGQIEVVAREQRELKDPAKEGQNADRHRRHSGDLRNERKRPVQHRRFLAHRISSSFEKLIVHICCRAARMAWKENQQTRNVAEDVTFLSDRDHPPDAQLAESSTPRMVPVHGVNSKLGTQGPVETRRRKTCTRRKAMRHISSGTVGTRGEERHEVCLKWEAGDRSAFQPIPDPRFLPVCVSHQLCTT